MWLSTMCNKAQRKHGALVALCLFLLSGCAEKEISAPALPNINHFIVDSIFLPITDTDRPKGRIKEVGRGKYAPKELIAFLRYDNHKLYFYDVGNALYLDSISLEQYRNQYPDFDPVGIDSVYVGLESNKIVSIFNDKTKEWDVSSVTRMIGSTVYIASLSAYPLAAFNDTIICATTTSERKTKVGPNIPFIKSNYDISFVISGDSIKSIAKYNPNPQYFLTQDYNASIERLYLNSQEIVYNFDCSDTLQLYNVFSGKTKTVKLKTNNFYANSPYNYDSGASMDYLTTYSMGNSRLGRGSLYYDNSRHRLYQLMQHRGTYRDKDGTKHDFTELPKSLFVLDDRLNQLMEIYIPPNTFSSKFFSFITHKGLYFAAHPSKQKYRDRMLFYRIVVP
ncbi:MAG: hypothetical protein EOO01_04760 [Chitinophagaceae bacterium]|nr:MAG: hypothetical protein EOO01_04760 [Chitinophagaceae bacterium]